jgi:hypothetical protein
MHLNSTGCLTLANPEEGLIAHIKAKKWWQGSVISVQKTAGQISESEGVEWWIVTSQTCNLYNQNFEKVPVFEVVAAKTIERCSNEFKRGDKPRTLHVQAMGPEVLVCLEVDIQKRAWLPRALLAEFDVPDLQIADAPQTDANWRGNQWLDNFAGWIARSYTRVTLPDEFNDALKLSRVSDVLDKKLADYGDELYGIYFLLSSEQEEEWNGPIGLLPPPYELEILLVTSEMVDPEDIRGSLVDRLFVDKITVKDLMGDDGKPRSVTRGENCRRFGINLLPASITAKATTEVSLQEIKSHIRYSNVDYLSDSSMAHP